ncbi:MAG: hypothetical protein Q4F03_10335 [Eubacteriales bacterium]|nr:hypothetical protein [Eubacteriales bacterium]
MDYNLQKNQNAEYGKKLLEYLSEQLTAEFGKVLINRIFVR